jgi:PEGA domain
LIKLFLLVSLSCLSALAAEPSKADEARRHAQRSRELYDDGDFSGALNEIERAYEMTPNFKLLYNMGQIQAQQLNYAAALKSFQRFLREGGQEITEARRTEVQREIEKLRARVAEVTISLDQPGAEIVIDDVVVGISPLAKPVQLNGGKHKVLATLQNYLPATKTIDVVGLENVTFKIELQRVASVSVPKSDSPSNLSQATQGASEGFPVWIPWAATGALAAGTVVLGVVALGNESKLKTLVSTYGTTKEQQLAAQSATQTTALATDVLLGVTAAAGVGSLIYTLVRSSPKASSPAASVSFTGNGFAIAGAF